MTPYLILEAIREHLADRYSIYSFASHKESDNYHLRLYYKNTGTLSMSINVRSDRSHITTFNRYIQDVFEHNSMNLTIENSDPEYLTKIDTALAECK